jgi:DNA-directed RNA polymerase subunit A"
MKRLLTEEEIEDILDFIKPNDSIPYETGLSIVEITKQKFRKELIKQQIYPEIIPDLKKMLEKNYNNSLIHPGESVGIIAAQSIGERQTQNSIAYDEEIVIKNHNKIEKIKIGEFIDNYIKIFGSVKLENKSEVQECENVQIMTITHNEKIEWKNISEVSRHPPKGNLVKVTTESGRSVISTLSHSHLKKDKTKVVPVLGSELKIGDKIPVIKNTPNPNCKDKIINIQKYINGRIGPKEYDSDGSTPLSSPTNKNKDYIYFRDERLPKNIEIDENLIWFLSVFLANGEILEKIYLYSHNRYDSLFHSNFENFCVNYDIQFTYYQKESYFFQGLKNNKTTTYIAVSSILSKFISNICNINQEFEKRIPEFIYGLDINLIYKFLETYFKEGGFDNTGDINKDICFLLSYFGIYSRIKNNKLYIQKKYNNEFHELFDIKINKNNLEDNFQTLDDEEINKELNKLNYNKNFPKINTDTELNEFIIKYMTDLMSNGNIDIKIKDKMNYIFQVKDADVVWEKITKLELIFEKDYNNEFVYDFSVKGNETFALFSGIVVHNTLNTFHKAGQSEKSVTVGVPRFQELLNATKTPRMVNCKIFFNEGNNTIQDLRNTINHNLVCLTLKDLSNKIEICMDKEEEDWYDFYKILYNDNFEKHKHCISVKLNTKILYKYRLPIQNIAKIIESNYDDLFCVFSPINSEQLDIFIDTSNIQFSDEKLLFINPDNMEEIYIEECVLPILEKMVICGITGIESIYFIKSDKDEWYVETDGSNFKKLLGHPIVDMTRLHSNNVWDIYESLGIEAAREFLISEFLEIMEGINECHVKLLVEKMTYSGTISSISRYTLKKDESGPMSKASFEESVDNYLKSAFAGDIEKTKGVSAAIICGKRANMGTGMMDLKININQLPNSIPIFKDKNNDGIVNEYRAMPKIKPFTGKI